MKWINYIRENGGIVWELTSADLFSVSKLYQNRDKTYSCQNYGQVQDMIRKPLTRPITRYSDFKAASE